MKLYFHLWISLPLVIPLALPCERSVFSHFALFLSFRLLTTCHICITSYKLCLFEEFVLLPDRGHKWTRYDTKPQLARLMFAYILWRNVLQVLSARGSFIYQPIFNFISILFLCLFVCLFVWYKDGCPCSSSSFDSWRTSHESNTASSSKTNTTRWLNLLWKRNLIKK